MEPERECRVLSIQSHVVRGYVGNKAATFPLQLQKSSEGYVQGETLKKTCKDPNKMVPPGSLNF